MKNPFAQLLNKKPSPEEVFRGLKDRYINLYAALSKVEGMQQKLAQGVMAAERELLPGLDISADEKLWTARFFALTFMEQYQRQTDLEQYQRNAESLNKERMNGAEYLAAKLNTMSRGLDWLIEHPQACLSWVESKNTPINDAEIEAQIEQIQLATL